MAEEEEPKPTRLCLGCYKPTYHDYCGDCAKHYTCAHGVTLAEGCAECDVESDRVYDEWLS